jgi:hypothetical protein
MIVGILKNFVKARRRPENGSSEQFWATIWYLVDNPEPPLKPYVAPCGGMDGDNSDLRWWEERLEDRIYEDDDESFGAHLNRILRAKKLERENTERAQEAIELRERLERGYRVHGWDKLERAVSIIEASSHRPQF